MYHERPEGGPERQALRSLPCQRDYSRAADLAIPSQERHLMNDAGRGDELVRWITPEIKPSGGSCHHKIQWPDMNSQKRVFDVRVVQVQTHPSQLNELRQFP